MPTYEYVCRSCDSHLEVVQRFDEEPLSECPACGGALRKVFGSIGIAFKGSGFYKTDSRASTKTPAGTSAKGGDGAKGSDNGSAPSGGEGGSSSGTGSDGGTDKPAQPAKDAKSSEGSGSSGPAPASKTA